MFPLLSMFLSIIMDVYAAKNEAKHSRIDQVKFVEYSLKKIWNNMVCFNRSYYLKIFTGCIPQILLDPFLNTFV